MSVSPVITAQDIRLVRGLKVLAEAVSFTLAPGEVLHVTGANGAGKTTLLECCAGLRRPDAGTLTVPPGTEGIWIGHRNGLAPELPAAVNLEHWCRLHGGDISRIASAMAFWRLPRAIRRSTGQLSAGQQQRVALATLACKPAVRLWILDEPMASLDADARPKLAELMRKFADEGGAILLTTHLPIPGLSVRTLALTA